MLLQVGSFELALSRNSLYARVPGLGQVCWARGYRLSWDSWAAVQRETGKSGLQEP